MVLIYLQKNYFEINVVNIIILNLKKCIMDITMCTVSSYAFC